MFNPLFLDIHTILLEDMSDFDKKQTEFLTIMPEFSTINLVAYSTKDVEDGAIRVALTEPESHLRFLPLNKILIRLNNLIMAHLPIIVWSEWTIPYLKAIYTYAGTHLGKVIDTKPWKGEVLALQNLLNEGRWGNTRVDFEWMALRLGLSQPWEDEGIIVSSDMPVLLKSHSHLAIAYTVWRVAVLKILADRMAGNFILDYGQQSDDYQAEAAEALVWFQKENLERI